MISIENYLIRKSPEPVSAAELQEQMPMTAEQVTAETAKLCQRGTVEARIIDGVSYYVATTDKRGNVKPYFIDGKRMDRDEWLEYRLDKLEATVEQLLRETK